jgi:hypothetical protein
MPVSKLRRQDRNATPNPLKKLACLGVKMARPVFSKTAATASVGGCNSQPNKSQAVLVTDNRHAIPYACRATCRIFDCTQLKLNSEFVTITVTRSYTSHWVDRVLGRTTYLSRQITSKWIKGATGEAECSETAAASCRVQVRRHCCLAVPVPVPLHPHPVFAS